MDLKKNDSNIFYIVFIIIVIISVIFLIYFLFRSSSDSPFDPINNPTDQPELPAPATIPAASNGELGFEQNEVALRSDNKYKTEINAANSNFSRLSSNDKSKYPNTIEYLVAKDNVYTANVGKINKQFVFSLDYPTAYKTIVLFPETNSNYKVCLNNSCNSTQTVIKCKTNDWLYVENNDSNAFFYLEYTTQD